MGKGAHERTKTAEIQSNGVNDHEGLPLWESALPPIGFAMLWLIPHGVNKGAIAKTYLRPPACRDGVRHYCPWLDGPSENVMPAMIRARHSCALLPATDRNRLAQSPALHQPLSERSLC